MGAINEVNNRLNGIKNYHFSVDVNKSKTITFGSTYTGFLTARARAGGEHYCWYISGYGDSSIRQNNTAIAVPASPLLTLSYTSAEQLKITNSSSTADFSISLFMLIDSVTSIT